MKTPIQKSPKLLNFANRLLIGFVITLFVVFTAFEYTIERSLPKIETERGTPIEDDFLPPITIRKVDEVKKPEPPKQKTPEMKIVEKIVKTETIEKPDEKIESQVDINIDKNYYGMGEEIIDEDEPPRSSVEIFPHTAACAGLHGEALKACSMQDIVNHIKKSIEIPEILKDIGGSHGANMIFVINELGKVEQIRVDQQTHKSMGEAAKKAIEKLPQMTPPSQHGQAVSLTVTVPVVVDIQ
ncbi:MAG: energy transducer TonB [Vicingaceae bacterium]